MSPFLPVAGLYRLRLPEPGGTLRLSVTLHLDGRTVLAASVTGKPRTYTPWRLLVARALGHPWVTGQVTALIHWQGIRLAARRLPIIPRPGAMRWLMAHVLPHMPFATSADAATDSPAWMRPEPSAFWVSVYWLRTTRPEEPRLGSALNSLTMYDGDMITVG